MNFDPAKTVQEALNELGTKGLVDGIPNVVDAMQSAVCVPENDVIHVFWDISLADQYGKFGPGSKHYSAFSRIRPEWVGKETLPDLLRVQQMHANHALMNAIAQGRHVHLAQTTSEEVE